MTTTDGAATWETACRCGQPGCRSGWPADAPLPADLPDPLPFLDEQIRKTPTDRAAARTPIAADRCATTTGPVCPGNCPHESCLMIAVPGLYVTPATLTHRSTS